MSDDFVLNVKQILQYPQPTSVLAADGFLLQTGGIGGPYRYSTVPPMLGTGMLQGGWLNLAPGRRWHRLQRRGLKF